MIELQDLLERREDLTVRLNFALATSAKATEKRLRAELEIIELAMVTLKRSIFNDN